MTYPLTPPPTARAKNNASLYLFTQKNLSPNDGEKLVCSTDNIQYSNSDISNETCKSVVEKTIENTVTEKLNTTT